MAKTKNRNEKRLAVKLKMSKKRLKTITKKTAKGRSGEEAMEVDDSADSGLNLKKQNKLNKKIRRISKMSKDAAERLPQSSEVNEKRQTKVNENRLRAKDCPLFLNPKAKNLKNVAVDSLSQTVVVPTRRVSKKKIRKLMKAKQRDDRAKERAAKAMDTN